MKLTLVLDIPVTKRLEEILSEGEQRAIAIGSFLPVSSLDHYWRKNVAARLVEEAKTRQAVGDECTLLVCCGAFRAKRDAFSNLTLKKIPNAVLNRCEFGRDDYSLEVEDLPETPIEPGTQATLFAEKD